MFRKITLVFVCAVMLPFAAKNLSAQDFVDLCGQADKCDGQKVFPPSQGRSCPSGDFQKFTIRQVSDFGERPVWSPDGKKIAFVEKEFGNVWELDLDSGRARCLTCNFKNQGFLRVHYMKDGDFLLLGPQRYQDAFSSRVFHTGFLWMPADLSKAPQWIGEEHYEGVAVSRESRKIAYTKTWLDTALHYPSALYVAELTRDGKIVNSKAVYRSPQLIEAQDFLPGDRGIVFTRYTPTYEAFGIDLATKQVTNYSLSPASEEPEGIFPDGVWTLMESDRHARKPGDMDLDIYMLKLDGIGKNVRRLTNFSDTPGQKASNPAVSPEGCRVAFMKSVKADDTRFITGKGAGLYLLEFYDCKQ